MRMPTLPAKSFDCIYRIFPPFLFNFVVCGCEMPSRSRRLLPKDAEMLGNDYYVYSSMFMRMGEFSDIQHLETTRTIDENTQDSANSCGLWQNKHMTTTAIKRQEHQQQQKSPKKHNLVTTIKRPGKNAPTQAAAYQTSKRLPCFGLAA